MTVEEKPITLVQQYPVLFDSGHKDYYNITLKEHIWEEIGAELQEPGRLKVIGIKPINRNLSPRSHKFFSSKSSLD